MWKRWPLVLVALGGLPSAAAVAAPPLRQFRLGEVILKGALPADLTRPEGKTRWDFTSLARTPGFTRTIETGPAGVTVSDGGVAAVSYHDPDGEAPSGDAARWLYPDQDRDALRPGTRERLEVIETRGETSERLRIETEVIGIGWLHLPSGPREVVLQEALILREPSGLRGFNPDELVHRWIDPLAGVVAEAWRPAAPDGREAGGVQKALVVEQVLLGAASLKIYAIDVDDVAYSSVAYGWDRGAGTTVASLTPAAYATIGDLLAANSWDFSSNTSGIERASTTVPLSAAETCNASSCGYSFPGAELDREDRGDIDPDPNHKSRINTVTQREDRGTDLTIWLRAGAQNEGKSGSLGTGESRFCYVSDPNIPRTQAALWRFTHQDAQGWYMQAGDPGWSGGPGSACQQTLFNCVCGAGCTGLGAALWASGNRTGCTNHTGTQGGAPIKSGVVTLPSGHTFNALVVSNIADFCVYLASGCSQFVKVDEVRTVNYLWQVPKVGTVVRLQSVQNAADANTFSTLAETDIKYGFFPPRSITVTGTTDTTLSLSWDPGLDTHRISGYRVYWDTDSGSISSYAFNSTANPGQVSIAGTTATISGLTPGTTYYVTVTSLSDFTDPSSLITTTYESILYPTQVSGDPSFVYPTEAQALTTGGACVPTAEVTNLSLDYAPAGQITFCWDPVSDPCLTGYRILGSSTPSSAGGFGTVADTGLSTCWTGSVNDGFFLVAARGTGGTGPWGAFGQ